jgi:hypothetical protein
MLSCLAAARVYPRADLGAIPVLLRGWVRDGVVCRWACDVATAANAAALCCALCRFEKFIGTEQGDHLARQYNENSFLLTMQVSCSRRVAV